MRFQQADDRVGEPRQFVRDRLKFEAARGARNAVDESAKAGVDGRPIR
jgi:hypothetical protein